MFIRKNIKLKYKNILYISHNVISRENFKKNLLIKAKNCCHSCQSCEYFSKIFKNRKIINEIFYKKFNSNLKLKFAYDKNLKKINNKNACIRSYHIFFQDLQRDKNINFFQKLNTLLKLNDLILVESLNKKKFYFLDEISELFTIENKMIKKFLND